jgi:hypothetical protein
MFQVNHKRRSEEARCPIVKIEQRKVRLEPRHVLGHCQRVDLNSVLFICENIVRIIDRDDIDRTFWENCVRPALETLPPTLALLPSFPADASGNSVRPTEETYVAHGGRYWLNKLRQHPLKECRYLIAIHFSIAQSTRWTTCNQSHIFSLRLSA